MASTMTVMPSKQGSKGLFGGKKSVPVWLQFVPGIVVEVCVSTGDLRTGTNIIQIIFIFSVNFW